MADGREEARFSLARRFSFLTRFHGVPHFPDLVAQQFVPLAQPGHVSTQAETIGPTRAPPRQASLRRSSRTNPASRNSGRPKGWVRPSCRASLDTLLSRSCGLRLFSLRRVLRRCLPASWDEGSQPVWSRSPPRQHSQQQGPPDEGRAGLKSMCRWNGRSDGRLELVVQADAGNIPLVLDLEAGRQVDRIDVGVAQIGAVELVAEYSAFTVTALEWKKLRNEPVGSAYSTPPP